MQIAHDKSTSRFAPWWQLLPSTTASRRTEHAHDHIESFTSLVKYLVRLRRDGTLDDEDFAQLVKMVSTAFVESEIADRVDSILDNKALNRAYLLSALK